MWTVRNIGAEAGNYHRVDAKVFQTLEERGFIKSVPIFCGYANQKVGCSTPQANQKPGCPGMTLSSSSICWTQITGRCFSLKSELAALMYLVARLSDSAVSEFPQECLLDINNQQCGLHSALL